MRETPETNETNETPETDETDETGETDEAGETPETVEFLIAHSSALIVIDPHPLIFRSTFTRPFSDGQPFFGITVFIMFDSSYENE